MASGNSEWDVVSTTPVVRNTEWDVVEEQKRPLGLAGDIGEYAMAVPETAARMVAGMTGVAGGALGAGVASIPDLLRGRFDEAAGGIRRGMEEGAERAVPKEPFFYPTTTYEEFLAPIFEKIREGMGAAGESLTKLPKTQEELERRAKRARMSPDELMEMLTSRAAMGRTIGEYAFDAPVSVAPLAMVKRAVAPNRLLPVDELPIDTKPRPAEASPASMADKFLANVAPEVRAERTMREHVYEVPDELIVKAGEQETTVNAIREFQERGYTGEALITEVERTVSAVRRFQEQGAAPDLPIGPGRKQRGALIPTSPNPTPRKRNGLEESLDIPAGFAPAVPDLIRPLDQVIAETISVGEAMTNTSLKVARVELKNDVGPLTKYWMDTEKQGKFLAYTNPAIKAVGDRIQNIQQYVDGLREDFIKGSRFMPAWAHPNLISAFALRHIRRFREGILGLFEILPRQEQVTFMDLRLKWDRGERQQKLIDEGRIWPTREELAQEGYSQKVIDAYIRETEYMDAAYRLINGIRELAGKDPIARIPGYFPHTYLGHMGIKIMRIVRNSDGTVEKFPVGFTKTRGGYKAAEEAAAGVIEQIKKEIGKEVELKAEIDRTDKPGNTADILDALETSAKIYANADKPFTLLVKNALEGRISSIEQQFLQASMKRHGLTGWIGSQGVTRKNVEQIAKARNRYFQDLFNYIQSELIRLQVSDTISPEMWNKLGRHLPQTEKTIKKMIDVARDKIPLSNVDIALADAFSKYTRQQFPYRAPFIGANKLRGLFAIKDLAWSVSYHFNNAIQPEMFGWPSLVREYSRIGKGDPFVAAILAEKEFIAPSRLNLEAIKWAAKKKIITPRLMEEVDFLYRDTGSMTKDILKDMVTGRRLSELNESVGRLRTFVMGLEYYRSAGLKEGMAREASGKFTNDVMVNYQVSGLPLWISYNPLGQLAGRMVAPYASFMHSFWGHVALSFQAMKRNPGLKAKIAPFLALQATIGTIAGIKGIVGFAEVTAAISLINASWERLFNEEGPLPDPLRWLIREGISDPALFGILSSASKNIPGLKHGVDVSGTAAAPSVTDPVSVRTAEGLWEIVNPKTSSIWNIGKIITGTSTDSEKLKLLKDFTPNWTHGFWEGIYRFSDEVSPDERNRMRGGVDRDQYDWNARIWTGKRSLNEQRQMVAKRIVREKQLQVKERKTDITELAADRMEQEGYLDPELTAQAVAEGYTYKEFRQRVNELRKQRQRSKLSALTTTKERTRNRERIRGLVEELLRE